ncbi:hypothetical protein MMC30_004686 [Trapelia coarctata]|nr:hypothetical protein [Trapelia coarctata]
MAEPHRAVASSPSPRVNNMSLPRSGDPRSAQRKPAPSPLQVTQTSTPTRETFMQSPRDMESPHSSRGGSTPSYSPRSPIYAPAQDMAKSPRERLEGLLSAETPNGNKEGTHPYNPQTLKSNPLTAPKEGTYHPLRNISAPMLSSTAGGGLKKQYPADMASSIARVGTDIEPRFVPRTSSIDSTMSTVSSATSYSYNTQDQLSPNATEVAQAISAAGSAEGAIHQLLKEKKQSAAQNAQLWRLVNKQRTLVLGLNKDLDRALQDKERYRKKLREFMAQPPSVLVAAIDPSRNQQPPPRSASPTDSDSPDELPIQRHSVRESVPAKLKGFDRTSVKTVEEIISPTASSSSTTSLPLGSDGRQTPLQGSAQVDTHPRAHDGTQQRSEHIRGNSDTHGRVTPLKPLEIHKKIISSPEDRASPTSPELDKSASRGSFTARRSITTTTPRKSQQSPLFDTTPHAEDFPVPVPSPNARKAPPAPLTLHRSEKVVQQPEKLSTEDPSDSEYEDIEVDEIPAFERGRRKTREDDDREREIALLKEQESRSISKKSKRSKSATEKVIKEAPPPIHALPKSPFLPKSPMIRSFSPDEPLSEMQRHLSPPTSLAGVLSRPPSSTNSHTISERSLISPFPLSPGLPLSPRPADRPVNSPPPRLPREGANALLASPPLSPRIGPALPLSPRPPRREIPLPPHTPTSLISPMPTHTESEETLKESLNTKMHSSRELQRNNSESDPSSPRPWMASNNAGAGGIYRGLVSDSYPDLLLPPNALPSILVKVTSSRLKPSRPSRHSIISPKESEEPVFTLGISARSDFRQLWRVERATTSLPQLDQRLKKLSSFNAPLPDRALFTGHAPAKVDGRRIAIERYFEAILDTPMTEEAALLVSHYLSAQAIEVEDHDAVGRPDSNSPVSRGPDGRLLMEGYLTKRGKNFGGWKARFFVLDEPSLRYYDSPGGSLLGTIKLTNAQIGRQTTQHSAHSPSRAADDSDKEFRHAFLILEPKRNNSSSLVRHVLCAESDEERDNWVNALLEYVSGQPLNAERSRPTVTKSDSASSKISSIHSRHQTSTIEEGVASEYPSTDPSEALQAVSYEDTAPAPAPANMPFKKKKEPASPVPTIQNLTISGPSNANIIQDASAWGNKTPDSPRTQGKEQKKRSIWGNFRADKASSEALANSLNDHASESTSTHNDQTSSVYEASSINERPVITQAPLYHRGVFSIPLAEAVDMFAAMGSDSGLPSVVYRCLEYLEAKQGVKEQGIFRVSGGTVLMRNLESRFNTEGDVDLLAIEIEPDVHAVAGLLKTYFRKLPSPILTPEVHMEIVYASNVENPQERSAAYALQMQRLPLPNWTLLRAFSAYIIGVTDNSDLNLMTSRNLSTILVPTLQIPGQLFTALVDSFETLFAHEPDQLASASIQVTAPSPAMNPDDIRSPRHQVFGDVATPSYNQSTFANGGLGLTYEEVLQHGRTEPTSGFSSLNDTGSTSGGANHGPSVTMPGPEYGAFQRTLAVSGNSNSNSSANARETRARRRESSMLLSGFGGSAAQRKSSIASMNQAMNEEDES